MEPLSLEPDQSWLGNDGPWSVFGMGVGTPVQSIKALVSTSMGYPLVVDSLGCSSNDSAACPSARGGFFNSNGSQTWSGVGLGNGREHSLGNISFDARGQDNFTLGVSGANGTSVGQQGMAVLSTKAVFLAMLTIRAFTPISPAPTLLQNLKLAGEVPSLSWGYTAGSYRVYQANEFGYGSLTLGGYDAAQFIPSNVVFPMDKKNDSQLELALTLQTIESYANDVSESLLPESVIVSLDSSTPYIWLPEEACERFETAFDLTYDQDLDLYLVNDTVHEELLAKNATVRFGLGGNLTAEPSPTVTIDIPYSSFDLTLTQDYPGNNETRYYFPLHQTANASLYTLGRTFFQNAYIIADYERSTFSINQALFPIDGRKDLRTIYPLSSASNTTVTSSPAVNGLRLSAAAIAGIVVGIVVLMIVAFMTCWLIRRRRQRDRLEILYAVDLKTESKDESHSSGEKFELQQPIPELENTGNHEMAAGEVASETRTELQPIPELGTLDNHELPAGEVASEVVGNTEPMPGSENPNNHELAGEEVAREMKADIPPRHDLENHELAGEEAVSEMKANIPLRHELEG